MGVDWVTTGFHKVRRRGRGEVAEVSVVRCPCSVVGSGFVLRRRGKCGLLLRGVARCGAVGGGVVTWEFEFAKRVHFDAV